MSVASEIIESLTQFRDHLRADGTVDNFPGVHSVRPLKCPDCRERAVVPETLPDYSIEMHYDGLPYPFTLFNFDVLRCQKCGSMLLGDESLARIDEAMRDAVGPSYQEGSRPKLKS